MSTPSPSHLDDASSQDIDALRQDDGVPSHIVDAFRPLSIRSRRAVLKGLLNELTVNEWCYLKLESAVHPLTHDPMDLPTELLAEIFSYLNITTPFRLQSVSKRWNAILRSDELLNLLLNKWWTPHDNPLEGEAALQGNPYQICRLKAEYWYRVSTCKNPQYLHIQTDNWCSRFAGDTLAWLSGPQPRVVQLYNFRTGQYGESQTAERGEITNIAMSAELVVYLPTMRNYCYAVDVRTRERRQFRLPGHYFHHLECYGRFVVGGANLRDKGCTEIFIWSFDSRKCSTFNVCPTMKPPPNPWEPARGPAWKLLSRLPRGYRLLADPDNKTVTVFSAVPLVSLVQGQARGIKAKEHPHDGKGKIFFSQFSFDGALSCIGNCQIPDAYYAEPFRIEPNDCDGRYIIRTEKVLIDENDHFEAKREHILIFDLRKNRFDNSKNYNFEEHVGYKLYWKDVTYTHFRADGVDPRDELRIDTPGTPLQYGHYRGSDVLVTNGTFIVAHQLRGPNYRRGFGIWWFDNDIRLPDPQQCPMLPLTHRQA